MSDYVPKDVRERVVSQARHRCGYCLTTEKIVGTSMEIDHIIPHALGGLTEENNLWLACAPCNEYKGDRIIGFDPIGRATVVALNLNRATLVQARQIWVEAGWHPPKD